MQDMAVVFTLDEVGDPNDIDRQRFPFKRDFDTAAALPEGDDYVLQLLNCENVGDYMYGVDGTAPSALSMDLEVRLRPALFTCALQENTVLATCGDTVNPEKQCRSVWFMLKPVLQWNLTSVAADQWQTLHPRIILTEYKSTGSDLSEHVR